ncbi:hypothetical protein HY489_02220 [Candidatus Woesearchaeota archaeon]|nr:hypothetical protein [Candidatus Woesearchaeota archaeon]
MARHVPISILAIVAVFGIATLLFSVSMIQEPVPLAVTYVGRAVETQGNTVIVNLDVGEFIGSEVEALTEQQLAGLKSGTVHGQASSTRYTQVLRFEEAGVFNGGRVVFGRDEQSRVTDFLEFQDGVFKFDVEFGSGLESLVEDNRLPDFEDENIFLLGETFSIVEARVDTGSNRITLRLFGGYGSIEFVDNNYEDDNYNEGVKVNGQHVDARVKIRAAESGDRLTIFSIQYILNANAMSGDLQVIPLHCTREFLQYPLGLLSPSFDICYKGMSGQTPSPTTISGNEVLVNPSGDDEYVMIAKNTRGQLYRIPLAQLPGMYGIKGRDFIFVEAGALGAPNIPLDTYFLVNSKNDVFGSSHVLRYDRFEGNVAYFEDLAGDVRSASVDPTTMQGRLLVGDGQYIFQVGAGNAIAMDQTNDGAVNGGEARFVFQGGSRADFGPGFTVSIITPERLFDEPAGDEVTTFTILFGGNVDLNVPSPQGTVFELHSSSGGHRQGLTRYGILFDWDTESDADSLRIVMPGGGGVVKSGTFGQVFITLERQKLVKPTQVPAPPAKCGDSIITKPEFCDPPGSVCSTQLFERGACSADCARCVVTPKAACGNNLIEPPEQCEKNVDCGPGMMCNICKCVAAPPAVCGNGVIEPPEVCERNADCGAGKACAGCNCVAASPNCAVQGKCRIWAGCGSGGDTLMVDGVAQGCVDPYKAAGEGIDYCGAMPLARNSQACNYMDSQTRQSCVCPGRPERQYPAPVEKASLWQRFVGWLRSFIWPAPEQQYAAGTGVNCKNALPCRFWDDRCGRGFEPLYVDGVFKECIDAYQGASRGIPYCAHKPMGLESAYCNYMSNDLREKLPCVCV